MVLLHLEVIKSNSIGYLTTQFTLTHNSRNETHQEIDLAIFPSVSYLISIDDDGNYYGYNVDRSQESTFGNSRTEEEGELEIQEQNQK